MDFLLGTISSRQLTKMEELFAKYKDEKEGWSKVQRKKRTKRKDPSLVSPAATRSRNRADVGAKIKSLGRKKASQIRQKEASRNIVDGT